jgi:hypothetical protein
MRPRSGAVVDLRDPQAAEGRQLASSREATRADMLMIMQACCGASASYDVTILRTVSQETPTTIKVGVQLPQQHCTIEQLRQAWREADQAGFDSLWVWDHFFPLFGDPDGPHYECWSLAPWCRAPAIATRIYWRTWLEPWTISAAAG